MSPAPRWAAPLFVACALSLSLSVALTPFSPCIDLPQHVAMGAQLARLFSGDAATAQLVSINLATHNAGVHLFVASVGSLVGFDVAGRLFVALYPAVALASLARLLRSLGLPWWRSLLIVPALLGFSFAWGFANFCMGTALSWLALSLVVEQLERPRASRAALLGALSLVVGTTHVLSMLLLSVVAASFGLERLARGPRTARRALSVLLAGLPLLAGCLLDLAVLSRHLDVAPGSYTSPPSAEFETSLPRKLLYLGTHLGGLFGTFGDTALCWLAIATVVAALIATRKLPRQGALFAPALLMLFAYIATPSVFANTHLVYQRFALWALAMALVALEPGAEASFRPLSLAAPVFASLMALLVPLHMLMHTRELDGLDEALSRMPSGAPTVGVIENARTAWVRMPVLVHAAAWHVARRGLDDGFSFARYLGLPVIYRPGQAPPYPWPSWEHDGRRFDQGSALARRSAAVLVRSAWPGEPGAQVAARLYGYNAGARVLGGRNGWWAIEAAR